MVENKLAEYYPKLAQIQMNLKKDYPEASCWEKPTEEQLDCLQWAKEFMDSYERRRTNKKVNKVSWS